MPTMRIKKLHVLCLDKSRYRKTKKGITTCEKHEEFPADAVFKGTKFLLQRNFRNGTECLFITGQFFSYQFAVNLSFRVLLKTRSYGSVSRYFLTKYNIKIYTRLNLANNKQRWYNIID